MTALACHAPFAPLSGRSLTMAAFVAMVCAGPVLGQGALKEDRHVTDSLVAGRVGDVIRTQCASISVRWFVAYGKLNDLKAYALAKGYAEAAVKAFLRDKAEKARIAGLADAYLARAGARPGDRESYCRVGRDEIARGTLAGSMLRSWK
jgi:hypothetical protein